MIKKETDKSKSDIDSMEIAPRFKVKHWKKLNLDDPANPDWHKAVDVFKSRIFSRFIEPADILIEAYKKDSSKKVGFAVLALDFIVIETIQGFIEGKLDRSDPPGPFKRFLTTAHEFKDVVRSEGFAMCIYGAFRSGIIHQGQTDGNFRVRADGKMIQRRGKAPKYDITINRTKFHEAVKSAFERYCYELSDLSNKELRCNFRKKMDYICGI
ncbi:MAG: hypothetical protein ABIB41_12350 [Nitrospirota bacterium]